MKEIGGYLQLEQLSGETYYPDLLPLNLGRTALLYALEKLSVTHLYVPDFICDSVTSVLDRWKGKITFYNIGSDFLPDASLTMEQDGWLYLINYYGQISNDTLEKFRRKYGPVIVDNTHSFFQQPVKNIPTLYSCRKYFGLPDGAYLSLPETPADFMELPVDHSAQRMEHILGRYEKSASPFYQKMLDTAHSFHDEPIKRMSALTGNLLCGIDYTRSADIREKNYRTLESLLEPYQTRRFIMSKGPFVYPFYSKNAASLKKQLAQQKIFVPTYWNNVIAEAPKDSPAYDFAAHILPLPVDQRYSTEDMEHAAHTLISLLANKGD